MTRWLASGFVLLFCCEAEVEVPTGSGGDTGTGIGGSTTSTGMGADSQATSSSSATGASSSHTSSGTGAGDIGGSSNVASGGSGVGANGSGGAGGAGQLPAEGATTECQVIASVGAWYDEPQGSACTSCIREISGQDGVVFTPCSTLGIDCYLDSGCHGIWICLSETEYAMSELQGCVDDAPAASRALFVELLTCILPWCDEPDQCAYSGETPGCELP